MGDSYQFKIIGFSFKVNYCDGNIYREVNMKFENLSFVSVRELFSFFFLR